ncbi:MAG: hypothetical protein ACOYXB_16490 [Bacteroidota bacterium]
MRSSSFLLPTLCLLLLFSGCEEYREETDVLNPNGADPVFADDFGLVINDSVAYNSASIDFYDFSSQLIYLRKNYSYTYAGEGSFTVLAGEEEIYSGLMYPVYASWLPSGAFIRSAPGFYNDYIIPIGFLRLIDSDEPSNDDPRYDPRIIEALKKNNQYREGLSGEIIGVEKKWGGGMELTLQLRNADQEDLLILDPEKTGISLFHYFTNGLILSDSTGTTYNHRLKVQEAEPWDSWDKDWLSVIHGGETLTFKISYSDFDQVPPGSYQADFTFPGLAFQIKRYELQQNKGRIWLGQVTFTGNLIVE